MQWTRKDLSLYIKEKEYIDTLIIPLIPFNPASDSNVTKEAFQRELNQLFTHLLEKEYRGRIIVSPEYDYITGSNETEVRRINQWVESFQSQPLSHVFLFTFDPKWKKWEQELKGQLLWIPSMNERDLHSSETKSFVKEQVSQISELITAYW
ncbi:DUF2487 family protein [Halobacillus campisalis]|uniref:DUF2487 family protein n=1 Tax=Halobacillus campisalis TaxID=435909 RepID=A0ABW2K3S4_9BACI|nr:DUF2487 family protein [Halobacillus campisalis]